MDQPPDNNPYAPPPTLKSEPRAAQPTERTSVRGQMSPLTRAFSWVLTITGIVFLPVSLFPLLLPGLLVWIGWLLIGCGWRHADTPAFWCVSLGWNGFMSFLMIWLFWSQRGAGLFASSTLYMVLHLLLALTCSSVILALDWKHRRAP